MTIQTTNDDFKQNETALDATAFIKVKGVIEK